MGTLNTFFFDTYAFFEIIAGNPNYLPYKRCSIITTKLNLMELHHGLLTIYGKDKADRYYDKLVVFALEIEDEIYKQASDLKALHKKRRLSYVDCIGYTLAQRQGVKFLTGDIQFKDFANVEFVK